MSTKIKNTDTSEIVEITIIDPKSGCDWSGDFIGNVNDGTGRIGYLLNCDDDGVSWQGDTETIGWWTEYADEYERADHRLHNAEANSDLTDEQIFDMRNDALCVEFNDLASAMNKLAEEIENA